MLFRKVTAEMMAWKNQTSKHPLLMEGARQVGKTTIIQAFIQDQYPTRYVEINFIQRPDLNALFEGDISADGLRLKLKALYPELISHGQRGILFLDEIQQCPNAIVALKSLSLLNQFDVIASGSLLGVTYQKVSSFPVGYVERVTLYPLDFEEFIEAIGEAELFQTVSSLFHQQKSIPLVLHQKMLMLYRDAVVVGGMPEVVNSYLLRRDFNEVFQIQQRIVRDYQTDIAKYALSSERVKAREVFDSIPAQLGKENKKFQYKQIRSGARSSMYESSIQWLLDAGIAVRCHNLSLLELPLIRYQIPTVFKVYLIDTGLLIGMFGLDAQKAILLDHLGIAKGGLYENIVAIQLLQMKRELYYFDRRSTLEIDFITTYQGGVLPVEVKSGDNTRSRSLSTLLEEGTITRGIRISHKLPDYGARVQMIPFYLLASYLNQNQ